MWEAITYFITSISGYLIVAAIALFAVLVAFLASRIIKYLTGEKDDEPVEKMEKFFRNSLDDSPSKSPYSSPSITPSPSPSPFKPQTTNPLRTVSSTADLGSKLNVSNSSVTRNLLSPPPTIIQTQSIDKPPELRIYAFDQTLVPFHMHRILSEIIHDKTSQDGRYRYQKILSATPEERLKVIQQSAGHLWAELRNHQAFKSSKNFLKEKSKMIIKFLVSNKRNVFAIASFNAYEPVMRLILEDKDYGMGLSKEYMRNIIIKTGQESATTKIQLIEAIKQELLKNDVSFSEDQISYTDPDKVICEDVRKQYKNMQVTHVPVKSELNVATLSH